MQLITVLPNDRQMQRLYEWLAERTPDQAISHKGMPTFDDHCRFVHGRPYRAWYEILVDGDLVGNIYLTHAREIGIHIGVGHRGRGHGSAALDALRALHPGVIWANINPANKRSIEFFKRRGRLARITHDIDDNGNMTPMQVTYRLDFNEGGG